MIRLNNLRDFLVRKKMGSSFRRDSSIFHQFPNLIKGDLMIRFRCLNNLRDCLARKKMEKNLNPIQGICLIALKDPFWNNTKKNWKLSTMSECTIFYQTQQHQPSMNLITCSKCKKQDPSWHRSFTREYWRDKFSCRWSANNIVEFL